ncbi:ribulose-phosphate 3-epimerase [Legionella londiniensis]|uniref:Ribulose-phosphate 3-epimerase n=1 Tax=Legionella londiniensis TaxID=45068 RepID=A0A0W0VKV2_9GAMM|nr:ribulose-phosphate 3-epimerase [Legionella londiniensis]KTD20741.1 D-ribulose-5-phosphate-3-epimerase [Legionella londiniensis]STX92786.1 D-ribulose-5-phosphate-3-epimerase [Legionella londiniensis]
MTYQILPSLLSADLLKLGQEIEAVIQADADMLHFDVMDNHYVPNLTFGPALCAHIRKQFTKIPIDVHLMTTPVDNLIQQFAKAGATRISIHPDATIHLDRSLQSIRENGCQAGLVLNPATSTEALAWSVHRLDFVLVMTVNPGFGGQSLIPELIPKIKVIKKNYPDLAICVDGGIDIGNIAQLAEAGATEFVAGSAIFNSIDYKSTIKEMRRRLNVLRPS